VAKDAGMVCAAPRHPSRAGSRRAAVWTVKTRMNASRLLGCQLRRDGIEIVTLGASLQLAHVAARQAWRGSVPREGGADGPADTATGSAHMAIWLLRSFIAASFQHRPYGTETDGRARPGADEGGLLLYVLPESCPNGPAQAPL
jgi:hypothetical protein